MQNKSVILPKKSLTVLEMVLMFEIMFKVVGSNKTFGIPYKAKRIGFFFFVPRNLIELKVL